MTQQEKTALEIELRTQKNARSLLEKAVPPSIMEPGVRKFYDSKGVSIEALQEKLKGVSN